MRIVLLALLAMSCRESHSAPSGWLSGISPATIGPACRSMLGRTYRAGTATGRRGGPPPSAVDVTDPALPAVVRALGPDAITVDAEHVEIRLGHYTTRYADDEYDTWGVACFQTGPIPRYQVVGGATFLRSLGHGLYAFDSLL